MKRIATVLVVAGLHGIAHAQPPCNTATVEPASMLMMTTLSVQYERHVIPRLGIAALGGLGVTTNIAIGDRIHNYSVGSSVDDLSEIRYGRVHVGVQGNYYAEDFKGAHVGVELTYVHHGWANPDAESIHAFTGSAYGGWKWLWNSGLTVVVQAGLSVVETDADAMTGWRIDQDGTLGPIHLAANGSIGWSF
jgi:hypothetical protein